MKITKKKKLRLENDINDMITRKNPDSTWGIYLAVVKVAKYIMVAGNRREKEETNKEISNKTATCKACLQQKWSEAFKKCQDCMDNISSPSEVTMFIALISLSANTLKDAFVHLGGKLGDPPN